jgi:hypothetical protein
LVADHSNRLIRKIVISTASVTTLAGVAGSSGSTDGIGTNAKFHYPPGIAISAYGIAGVAVTTGATNGIAISPGRVYALVVEHENHLVRKIKRSDPYPSRLPTASLSVRLDQLLVEDTFLIEFALTGCGGAR